MLKEINRPYVLSIAGLDPSAGAGILSDIKTFEALKTYGFGVCSALTVQNDKEFISNEWCSLEFILNQIKAFEKFDIKAAKIGIMPSIEITLNICAYLKSSFPSIKIVLDPIWKASAGFRFQEFTDAILFEKLMKCIDVITPNALEMVYLQEISNDLFTPEYLSKLCIVYLKGGHNEQDLGTDIIYFKDEIFKIKPLANFKNQKHGSGCVLSSAITANLALGRPYKEAFQNAKSYIEAFLNSNDTLLGYHHG